MKVKVLKRFADLEAGVDREAGEVFDASAERASAIAKRLPGYVELSDESEGYGSMSIAQLRSAAKEAGIAVPKGSSKADIIELLEG